MKNNFILRPIELFDQYVRIYDATSKTNLEKRREILDEMIVQQQSSPNFVNNPHITLRIICCQYDYAFLNGEYHRAYTHFMSIRTLEFNRDDYGYLAKLYRNVCLMSYTKGAFSSAIENGYKALDYATEANNLYEEICACINIGLTYNLTDKTHKQLEFYKRAYDLTLHSDHEDLLPLILNNLAYAYLLMEDYEACHKTLEKAYTLDANPLESTVLPALYLTGVTLDIKEKNYTLANEKLMKLQKNPNLTVSINIQLDWYIEKANYYQYTGKAKLLNNLLREGLAIAKKNGSNQYCVQFLEKLYQISRSAKNYVAALNYQDEIGRIKNILINNKEDYQYMLYQVQYEIEKMTTRMKRLNSELRVTQESAIYTLASLAEYRDEITGKHILRTVEYVKAFLRLLNRNYESLNLTKENIRSVAQSSALHDIGKVGIKDNILLKKGKLTKDEFEDIKLHTIIGRDALATTKDVLGDQSFLSTAMVIAFTHHERWDGTGYPQGLEGDAIPLYGRLVAIVDVYDALISKRPYKDPYSHLVALDIIKKGRGNHFDPGLLDVFVENHLLFFQIALEHIDSAEEKESLVIGMDLYM